MQIKTKNRILKFLLCATLLFATNINAEEFNITADEILLDKNNEVITGIGSVKAVDSEGKIIFANKITYEKSKEYLLAEGNVKIKDIDGNLLITEKASYDKINEIIVTHNNTELILKEGYKILSKDILYDHSKKIISSNEDSVLSDEDGNLVKIEMFQYHIKNNLFSSIGNIDITDANKNKYFFKELYVDTKKKEMIASDANVNLDRDTFGSGQDSDPRFVANDIFISGNKTNLSKGVFTICKKREDKCPPWSIKAKKIIHDKLKKTIYYEHATLKVYDIPIFYFPRFYHPDPTVKRQSGFLAPSFANSSSVGIGTSIPYYFVIDDDKDLTFTPRVYGGENWLFFNEYRQAYKNAFLTLDTSYTQGYKNISSTKTAGSKQHLFANLDIDFLKNQTNEKKLSIKAQHVSDDTYFRAHDINTALVDEDNTNLENEIRYSFYDEDAYLDINTSVYNNLRETKSSDKYEYILPNIIYGKSFFNEKYGSFDLRTNALFTNYETNKQKTFLTNDVIWSPTSFISKNGFVSSVAGMLRNTNYETKNTKDYKDDNTVNELHSVISYKTGLPMKKDGKKFTKLFLPNLMFRYAPGHVRDLSSKDVFLDYTNLYSLNKTSEIEDGFSTIIGFDYKINNKNINGSESEKFSLSLGQIFNNDENQDLPSKSSLDQKMSDVVGNINYNFSDIGNIDYKFSIDHNLKNVNYNEIGTALNFGKVEFNLDYLEKQSHIGEDHYASSGVTLNINDYNKLSFSTKKNFKTESTELYNLSYQYELDCLAAGLVYRREFYRDTDDLEPNDTLMFNISFKPLARINTPKIEQ